MSYLLSLDFLLLLACVASNDLAARSSCDFVGTRRGALI